MTDLAAVNFFADEGVSQDPYEYWDYLREQGPVTGSHTSASSPSRATRK